MKKLKEKFSNNEYIIFIKKTWSNKKTRSWVCLGMYFIFFAILGILFRMTPENTDTNYTTKVDENKEYSVQEILINLENKSKTNYQYKIYINDEVINGIVENGNNSFTYQGYKYIFVYDKLYLSNISNLELIDNLLKTDIPIEYINLNNILDNVRNREYQSITDGNFTITYNIPVSNFIKNDNVDKLILKLIGNNDIINKISIIYNDNTYVLEIL